MADELFADERALPELYRAWLDCWNRRDACAYAALFTEDATVIGFDGSPMNGRPEFEATLRQIFADHQTAAYVAKAPARTILARR